jgi:type VI protein secretion system component VasA
MASLPNTRLQMFTVRRLTVRVIVHRMMNSASVTHRLLQLMHVHLTCTDPDLHHVVNRATRKRITRTTVTTNVPSVNEMAASVAARAIVAEADLEWHLIESF